MATHSSILAWEILWTEETDGLQSMVLKRVGHNLVTKQKASKETCSQKIYDCKLSSNICESDLVFSRCVLQRIIIKYKLE